jgi:D-alanine-D-alanine ligase
MRPERVELDRDLPRALLDGEFDVAFPVTHGPLGEDGCLQGLLEVIGLPYVGSDPRGSAVAAHKPTAKVLFRAAGVPVAAELVVRRGDDPGEHARRIVRELGTSVVVKPASGGSSIGVVRLQATDEGGVARGLEQVLALDDALVERFHAGLEVTCGVLEDDSGARALPPTLISAKASDWYDFTSRYRPGGSVHECPAPLGEERVGTVQRLAVSAHRALGARDLSRVDFVVEPGGAVVVLEVNTLPGMTATSNFPEAAQVSGISFPELCRRLCERAWSRPRRTPPQVLQLPT